MAEIDFDSGRIIRYFNEEKSYKETSYVNEVFCDNNKEEKLTKLLKKQWSELIQNDTGSGRNLDHILYKINYEIINNNSKPKRSLAMVNFVKWFARIAAILILPLGIYSGIHFFQTSTKEKLSWIEIKAPAWSRLQFSLPDGTVGWLNSSSNLKYSGNFIKDRNVILSGEAFFDVFRDEKSPFIVNADQVVVKVLGTRFNIASYENEKNVEVVLEEGKLIFNNKEMNKPFIMSPNDLVVFNKAHKEFLNEVVEPNKYVSWTEGKLIFRNDPLDVVARRLERWYNIDVEIKGNISQDLRLRATFIDENLEEVLYFLKRSLSIDYKIESGGLNLDDTFTKKKVIISPGIK